jgi:hypothetical protein
VRDYIKSVLKKDGGYTDLILLAQNINDRWTLVNTVITIRVPQKLGKVFSNWTTGGFSRGLGFIKLVMS